MAFTPPPVVYPARSYMGRNSLSWTGQDFVQRPDISTYQSNPQNYYPPSLAINPMAYGYTGEGNIVFVQDTTAPSSSKKDRYQAFQDSVLGGPSQFGLYEPSSGFPGTGTGSTLSPVGFVITLSSSILEGGGGFTPGLRFKNLGECVSFLTHLAAIEAPNIGKGWIEQDEIGVTVTQRGGLFKRKLPARFEIDKKGNNFDMNDVVTLENGVGVFTASDSGACMPNIEDYRWQYNSYYKNFLSDATGLPKLAWKDFQPNDTGAIWFAVDNEGPVSDVAVVSPTPFIIYPVPFVDEGSGKAYLMTLHNMEVLRGLKEEDPPSWKYENGYASMGRIYKIYPNYYPKQESSEYPDHSYTYIVNMEYMKPFEYSVVPIQQSFGNISFEILMCCSAGSLEAGAAGDIARQYFSGLKFKERA